MAANRIKMIKKVLEETFSPIEIEVLDEIPTDISFEIAVLALAHKKFYNLGKNFISNNISKNGFVYDLKGILPRDPKVIRL